MVFETTGGNEPREGTSAGMWLASRSTDYGPPDVSLGHVGQGGLQWPATSAGLQLYAFFGSKSVDPQNHGNLVLVPPALIIPPTQSPTATA